MITNQLFSPFKNGFRQVLPCQKVQCLKLNILFFNQRNEIYEEDYQFLTPFKKCITTTICILKISVFETGYTFFNQKDEMYVKEGYQYLSPFKKCIATKNFHAKKFQCLKFHTLFSTNGNKCMGKQSMTINFCHILKNVSQQKLPCQKVSVFEIEYKFFNHWK